jgi:SAM-dependent methyltransferase
VGLERCPSAIAAGKALVGGDGVDWREGDLLAPYGETADLTLLLGNTLSLFGSKADVKTILRHVADSLSPGGIFIFHVLDYDYLAANPVAVRKTLLIDGREAVFTKRIDPREGGGRITVSLSFPGGDEDPPEEEVEIFAWTREELAAMGLDVGLHIEATYGGLDGSLYTPGGGRDLVLVMRGDD